MKQINQINSLQKLNIQRSFLSRLLFTSFYTSVDTHNLWDSLSQRKIITIFFLVYPTDIHTPHKAIFVVGLWGMIGESNLVESLFFITPFQSIQIPTN